MLSLFITASSLGVSFALYKLLFCLNLIRQTADVHYDDVLCDNTRTHRHIYWSAMNNVSTGMHNYTYQKSRWFGTDSYYLRNYSV